MAYFLEFGNFEQPKYLVITTSADYPTISEWVELIGDEVAVKMIYDGDDRDMHEPIIKTSIETTFLKNNATNEALFDAILNDADDNVWAFITNTLRLSDDFTLPGTSIDDTFYTFDSEAWSFDIDSGGAPVLVDDWYLPAIDEAELFHNNIGITTYPIIWTSTEIDSDFAGVFYRIAGTWGDLPKTNNYQFFFSREFYSEVDKAIGDTWEEQGVKVYGKTVSGTGWIYKGAALYSQRNEAYFGVTPDIKDMDGVMLWQSTWSNVTDVEIGIDAQSFTDGEANTEAIISQDGHGSSAALWCDGYFSYASGGAPVEAIPSFDYELIPVPAYLEFQGSLVMEAWVEQYKGITPVTFTFTDRIGLLKDAIFQPRNMKVTVTELLANALIGISSDYYLAIEWPYTTDDEERPDEFVLDVSDYMGKDKEGVLTDFLDSFGLQMFIDFPFAVKQETGNRDIDEQGCIKIRCNALHGESTGKYWLYKKSGSAYELVTDEPYVVIQTSSQPYFGFVQADSDGYYEEPKLEVDLLDYLIQNDSEFEYDVKAKWVASKNDYKFTDNILLSGDINANSFFGEQWFGLFYGTYNEARFFYQTDFKATPPLAIDDAVDVLTGSGTLRRAWGQAYGVNKTPSLIMQSYTTGFVSFTYTDYVHVQKSASTKLKIEAGGISNAPATADRFIFIQPVALIGGDVYRYRATDDTWQLNSSNPTGFFLMLTSGEWLTDTFEVEHPAAVADGDNYRMFIIVGTGRSGLNLNVTTRLNILKVSMINTVLDGYPLGIRIQTNIDPDNRQRLETAHNFYNLPNLEGAGNVYRHGIFDSDIKPLYTLDYMGDTGTILSHVNYQKAVNFAFNRWMFKCNILRDLNFLRHIYKIEGRKLLFSQGEVDLKRGKADMDLIQIAPAPVPSAPGVPQNETIVGIFPTDIRLDWEASEGNVLTYHIERSDDDIIYAEIDTVDGDTLTYTDAGLDEATIYYYKLRAYNKVGYSDYTGTLTTSTFPAAPTDLSAIATAIDKIQLNWTDNSTGEARYHIERNIEGGAFSEIDEEAADTETYLDTGLSQDTAYGYRVRCSFGAGALRRYSDYSDTVYQITGGSIPGTPTGLAVERISPDFPDLLEVSATWNPSVGATSYMVIVKLDGVDEPAEDIGNYTDVILGPYDNTLAIAVKVAAKNAIGTSAYTDYEDLIL